MRRLVFVLFGLISVAGALEALSWLALQLRPTGNPLAYPARESSLHLYRPSDGWLFYEVKPGHEQRFRLDEFNTTVRTNNVGFREDRDFDGHADIAFVGDSFTFGHGVNAGERYSDRVRAGRPGAAVWSYAYPNGYAPPHYLLFLQKHPQFLPKTLVVGLFPWNDLGRDVADMVFERDTDGAVTAIRSATQHVGQDGYLVRSGSPERQPAWQAFLREFNLGRVFLLARYRLSIQRVSPPAATDVPVAAKTAAVSLRPVDRGVFDATAEASLAAVRGLAQLMRQNGGDIVVFFIPTSYMVGNYPYFCEVLDGYDAASCGSLRRDNALGLALQSWAKDQCLTLIDPIPAFRGLEQQGNRLYFEKDGHWTAAGHQAAADLLLNHLKQPAPAC